MKYTFENFQPKSDAWGAKVTYSYFTKTGKSTLALHNASTTCTDYLTDMLMYPTAQIAIGTKPGFSTSKTQIVCTFCYEASISLFLKYGLKVIHKIEELNGFCRTKVVKQGKHLIVIGSRMWMKDTFSLSLYLKLFRNLYHLANDLNTVADLNRFLINSNEFDQRDLRDWALDIAFAGKLREVNKYCRHVHGWKDRRDGNHSNNGIRYTIYGAGIKLVRTDWAYADNKRIVKDFRRIRNIKRLQQQINREAIHALPCM